MKNMTGDVTHRFPGWSYIDKKQGGANSAGDIGGVYQQEETHVKALFKREDNFNKVIAEALAGKIMRGLAKHVFANEDDFAEVDLVTAQPTQEDNADAAPVSEDLSDPNGERTYLRSIFFTGDIADLWQRAYKNEQRPIPERRPSGGGGYLSILFDGYRSRVNKFIVENDLVAEMCQQSGIRVAVVDFGLHAGNFITQKSPQAAKKPYRLKSFDYGAALNTTIETLDPFITWGNKSLTQIHKNHLLEYSEDIIKSPAMAQAFLKLSRVDAQTIARIVANSIADLQLDKRFSLATLIAFCYHIGLVEKNFADAEVCVAAIEKFISQRLKSRCLSLAEAGKQILAAAKLPDDLKIMVELDIIDAGMIVQDRAHALAFLDEQQPYRFYAVAHDIFVVFKQATNKTYHIARCRLNYKNLTVVTELGDAAHTEFISKLPAWRNPFTGVERQDIATCRRYIEPVPELNKPVVIAIATTDRALAKRFINGWERWAAAQWLDAHVRPFIIAYIDPDGYEAANAFFKSVQMVNIDFVMQIEHTDDDATSLRGFIQRIIHFGSNQNEWNIHHCHEFNLAMLELLCANTKVTLLPIASIQQSPSKKITPVDHNDDNAIVDKPTMAILAGVDLHASVHYFAQCLDQLEEDNNTTVIYWSNPANPFNHFLADALAKNHRNLWTYFRSLHDFFSLVARHCDYWVAPTVGFAKHRLPQLEWLRGLGRIQDHFFDAFDVGCQQLIEVHKEKEIAIVTTSQCRKAAAFERHFKQCNKPFRRCNSEDQKCIDDALKALQNNDELLAKELLYVVLHGLSKRANVIFIGNAELMAIANWLADDLPLTELVDCSQTVAAQAMAYAQAEGPAKHRYLNISDLSTFLLQLEKTVNNTRYWHKSSKRMISEAVSHYLPEVIKKIREILADPNTNDQAKLLKLHHTVNGSNNKFKLFVDKKFSGTMLKKLLRVIELTAANPVNWNTINAEMSSIHDDIEAYKQNETIADMLSFHKKAPTLLKMVTL